MTEVKREDVLQSALDGMARTAVEEYREIERLYQAAKKLGIEVLHFVRPGQTALIKALNDLDDVLRSLEHEDCGCGPGDGCSVCVGGE